MSDEYCLHNFAFPSFITHASRVPPTTDKSPDDPHYYGRRLKIGGADFYSGGGANILSRESLRRLGDAAKERAADIFVVEDTFADDMEIANTLVLVDVLPEDSRDADKKEQFHTLALYDERVTFRHITPDFWYFEYAYYPVKDGGDCCSKTWIASHYTTPNDMLLLEDMHLVKCEASGQHPWQASVQLP
eukprot:m.193217 g.193217  ORF g.193217 m.193217 type:complete len:189 (+) comp14877_c0_seq2:2799-3365(+)